ncbi:MAG TPA: glucose-6-phosphate isomerase, partial [Spirochaetota bacterium]|nr:glucose-6-phosphate isomerase [Spirochaetota bacterium]
MLGTIDPASTNAWLKLRDHYLNMKKIHMRDLFAQDKNRFEKFSLRFEDMVVDFSKNILTAETMQHLTGLAEETGLNDAIEKMFIWDRINETENRAVLHVALRNRSGMPVYQDGNDVMPEIHEVLNKMKAFCATVTSGQWKGYTGKPVTDIVNIGIGGSDLGPVMVTEALRPYWQPGITPHFV